MKKIITLLLCVPLLFFCGGGKEKNLKEKDIQGEESCEGRSERKGQEGESNGPVGKGSRGAGKRKKPRITETGTEEMERENRRRERRGEEENAKIVVYLKIMGLQIFVDFVSP